MPLVENRVEITDADLDTVWKVMCDFEAFPRLMQDVIEVSCFDRSGASCKSSWKVLLNGSELTWIEHDEFIDGKEIRFHQVEGDLEVWEGSWRIQQRGDRVIVDLIVSFDLGIPSLAHILDPIGIRAIAANARQMLEAIDANARVAAS
jgi:uncharacterized membrane protein